MNDWPDPRRSRIVLIGTSEYADDELSDLPEVKATINDLEVVLADPGYGLIPPDGRNCVSLIDEDDIREIGRQLGAATEDATDLLLVYYVGHGLIAGRRRELYLGLPGSDRKRPYFNSLEFNQLRSIISDSDAATKIVILDCCFSGLGPDDATTSPAPEIAEMFEVSGTCVLTSAPQDGIPLALAGERHTAFSGRLITVLQEGVPGGPDRLSTDDIYGRLVTRMAADGLGQPRKHDLTMAGSVALARNRAVSPAKDADTTIRLVRARMAPETLAATIADRTCAMSESCRDMLRAAAILGSQCSVTSLATVLGQRVDLLIPAVDEAIDLGILAERDGDLVFQNALTWEAVYGDVPTVLRAPWHREAGLALASSDAPVDCVATQLLHATAPAGTRLEKWMLDWLHGNADALIGQSPALAIELLQNALYSIPFDSTLYAWLANRMAGAYYRMGNIERAEQVAYTTLEYTSDPDLLVDLQWTLAQCSVFSGQSEQALATLSEERTSLQLSPRHRARLLIYLARLNFNLGEFTKAGELADESLAMESDAHDNWETGWALQVKAAVHMRQGQLADSLPYFERALTITQSDPALTDLRLLLQIDEASALENLDRHHEALIMANQTLRRAGQAGTAIRVAQAASLLGGILFATGQWDESLAKIADNENVKEPAAACRDLSTIAVISFHRGHGDAARKALTEAAARAVRFGRHRFIAQYALAQSLDRELAGDRLGALSALTAGLNGGTEEFGEVEFVLPDAVRLAMRTGDRRTARRLAFCATELAGGSQIPQREASGLYCQGLTESDPQRLLAAAARYSDASRPLSMAKAYEAAADLFGQAGGEEGMEKARSAMIRSVEAYESLGAAADLARVRETFHRHDMMHGPRQRLSLAAGIAGVR